MTHDRRDAGHAGSARDAGARSAPGHRQAVRARRGRRRGPHPRRAPHRRASPRSTRRRRAAPARGDPDAASAAGTTTCERPSGTTTTWSTTGSPGPVELSPTARAAGRRLLQPRVRRRGRRAVQPVDGRAPRPVRTGRRVSCGWRSACARSARATCRRSASPPRSSGPAAGSGVADRSGPLITGPRGRRQHRRDLLAAGLGRGRLGQRGLRDRAGLAARAVRRRRRSRRCSAGLPADLLARPTAQGTLEQLRRTIAAELRGRRSPPTSRWTSGCSGRPPRRRATAWRTPGSSGSPTPTARSTYRATYTAYDGRHIAGRMLEQRRPVPALRGDADARAGRRATRAWRCSRARSAAATSRCAAPTARPSG